MGGSSAMTKKADVKLRAFFISQDADITEKNSSIIPLLKEKLDSSAVQDRMLKRNSSIEITNKEFLDEEQLRQKMIIFLQKQEDEKNSHTDS